MKIRVLKKFRDKDSLEIHEQGDIVEYPLERAKFIISLGYAEEVKEVEEKAEATEEATEEKVEEKPKKKTTKSRGAVK
ncbi:hypothetical protein [Ezakiella coagulans]|uniref:hypothetical protein n=1 Tax=Ezakiella coagulans TaxID=46507 RepID=UPI00288977F3|nr:hypothetical protein [Ezakiella coagulans]